MNVITLVGRLTVAPELKHTETGIAVSRFSIAVDRAFQKQGEERQTDFINIVAWRSSAEFLCRYFKKGQRIGVTGSVRTGSYMDRDGIKRNTFEVYADRLEFVERKEKSSSSESTNSVPTDNQENFSEVPPPYNDELPY